MNEWLTHSVQTEAHPFTKRQSSVQESSNYLKQTKTTTKQTNKQIPLYVRKFRQYIFIAMILGNPFNQNYKVVTLLGWWC